MPQLGTYPEETVTEKKKKHMNPNVHCSTFTIAGIWKQPRCPSTEEWIRKLWYVNTMEYYSAIKRMHLSQF